MGIDSSVVACEVGKTRTVYVDGDAPDVEFPFDFVVTYKQIHDRKVWAICIAPCKVGRSILLVNGASIPVTTYNPA